MLVLFRLSMPNNNAWNGKWTGENNLYAIVKNLNKETINRIMGTGYYTYNFGDGWAAGILTSEISPQNARKVRRNSKGFCGYDWMVQSIIEHNNIICNSDSLTPTISKMETTEGE